MTASRLRYAAVAVAVAIVPTGIALVLVFDELLRDAGRGDLTQGVTNGLVYVLAMVSAATVGAGLALHRPRHPVGWLFLGLADLQAIGPALTGYAAYGAIARPGELPLATAAGLFADSVFVLWFVAIALVFHLTPDGRPLSPRWAWAARATVVAGVLGVVLVQLTPSLAEPPLDGLDNPWAPGGAVGDVLDVGRGAVIIATGAGLVVAAVSLLVRFRRARGTARQQLLWLAPAAVLIPVLVAASFVASYVGSQAVLGVVAGLFVVLLPVATALAITQYHLFEVDRILGRALTYALLTAVLAAVYVVVVVVAGAAVGDSQLSAVIATLAAVSVAAPLRGRLQDAVDRRFNRRRFDAVRMVRDHVHDPRPGVTIEHVLRRALADPDLRVAYWVEGRGEWVSGDGRPAVPGDDDVLLSAPDRPIASVGATAGTPRDLLEAAVGAARPELDNAGLRAAVALQLVEVRESRARIITAADSSRREIERNLHDGAQQRLVALAVRLGLARRLASGDTAALLDELRGDVVETLAELRDLAHGIYPPLLREHGLGEALRSAAGHAVRPTTVDVATDRRFAPGAEAAVYFCCLEAMQNAGKHAGPDATVTVHVGLNGTGLAFEVCDDGAGFDPATAGRSHGFVNMRDRLGALGGRLTVVSGPGRGTVVRGTLPV
ncbi:sensor histidine kinase [Jiangella alkaliphila]|uniref:histidine kinase n=1 Tax=Jiangella alkaliphila TaxID=419479 RepID=A0A1H2M6T3_9ACTN|nr:histidine kinase [Jiangella alkaliphila]SDU88960.1 Histidine kinase [Jiangella alkaliphila]